VEEYVFGLDVTMGNADGVHVRNSLEQGSKKGPRVIL
jgi:hypothetical protein